MTALPAVKAAILTEALSVAGMCRHLMDGELDVPRAKAALGHLSLVPSAARAHRQLLDILIANPADEITPAAAGDMLSALFGALGKRKADQMMLGACVSMFAPACAALDEVIGVKPICRHPVILALGIKKLIATSVFTPTPAELRAAMAEVRAEIAVREAWLSAFLNWIDVADRLVFAQDRAAWEAAYARVDGSVARAMLCGLNEGPGEETAPSPRWQALRAVSKQLAPPVETKSLATRCPGRARAPIRDDCGHRGPFRKRKTKSAGAR